MLTKEYLWAFHGPVLEQLPPENRHLDVYTIFVDKYPHDLSEIEITKFDNGVVTYKSDGGILAVHENTGFNYVVHAESFNKHGARSLLGFYLTRESLTSPLACVQPENARCIKSLTSNFRTQLVDRVSFNFI